MLPGVLSTIFATGITYTENGEAVPLCAAVSFKEANLLYALVRKTQPTQSLEIGMGQGVSTVAILGAIKENGFGHHHVIDPYEAAYENAGLAAVERAALTPYMTF